MTLALILFGRAASAAELGADAATVSSDSDIFGIFEEQAQAEKIVIKSSTLTAQTLSEAPSLVQVMTKDDVRRYHFRTLAELLQFVTGMDVISDHTFDDVGVRGVFGDVNANGSSLKVLVDGVDTAFRTTGHNTFSYSQIPLEAVERVEIIRGPMSVVYGANAFLGVINVVTRADTQNGAGAWARGRSFIKSGSGGGGAYGEYKSEKFFAGGSLGFDLSNQAGLRLPDVSLVVRNGEFADRSTVSASDVGRQLSANLHAGATPVEGLTLRLDYNHHWIYSQGQFQPQSLLSADNMVNRLWGDAQLDVQYKRKWFTAQLKGWFDKGGTLDKERLDFNGPAVVYHRNMSYDVGGGLLRLFFEPVAWFQGWVSAETEFQQHKLAQVLAVPRGQPLSLGVPVLGLTGTELAALPSWAQAKNAEPPLLSNIAVSAYTLWKPFNGFGVSAGGRVDQHSIYGTNFSFQAGLVYQREGLGYAKLLAGRAFKSPTPQQLFQQPIGVADFEGNPNLKAQTSNTFEAVIGSRSFNYLSFQLTGFYNLINNYAVYILREGHFVAQGVAGLRSAGAELELSVPEQRLFKNRLRLQASGWLIYQNTVADFDASLRYLLSSQNVLFPPFKAALLFNVEIVPAYIALSARFQALSARLTSQTNIQLQGGNVSTLPATALLDLGVRTVHLENLGPKLLKGLSIELVVRNVTGNDAPVPGYNGFELPRAPRTFEGFVRWDY